MNATEIIFQTETLEAADESVSMIRSILGDPPSFSWNTFEEGEDDYLTVVRATHSGPCVKANFIRDSCMYATDMTVETHPI